MRTFLVAALVAVGCGGSEQRWLRDPHFLTGEWTAPWTFGKTGSLDVDVVIIMNPVPAPVPVSGTFTIRDGTALVCSGSLLGTAQICGASMALVPVEPAMLPPTCGQPFALNISTPPQVETAPITGTILRAGQPLGDTLIFSRK